MFQITPLLSDDSGDGGIVIAVVPQARKKKKKRAIGKLVVKFGTLLQAAKVALDAYFTDFSIIWG